MMKSAVRQEDLKSEESSKQNPDTMLRKAWLTRIQSNQTQRSILTKLQTSLALQVEELAIWKTKCARLQAELKRLVDQGTMRCMEGDINALALRLIAGEDISTVVADARKGLESFYARMKAGLTFDREEADLVNAVDTRRAAVTILQQAVTLQKRNMAEGRKTSIVEFSLAITEARREVARQFLAALSECQKAAEQDRRFAEDLEPEEIELLRPQPFPIRILSEDALRWLFAAASQDLIGREDLRNARVDL
jgi:hypothetical protein